jgi:hypothetical protein
VFTIGILNHQNILLLIPTAIVIMWPVEREKTIVWVGAAATAAYFFVRFLLNRAFPVPSTYEIKVWFNMRQIAEMHRTFLFGMMLLIPWYAGAALAFKNADPFLKRASVLLPMQLAIYSVFGQLNEARLFNGFLPILIGIYLCYIRERFIVTGKTVDRAAEFTADLSALPRSLQRENGSAVEAIDPELRGK